MYQRASGQNHIKSHKFSTATWIRFFQPELNIPKPELFNFQIGPHLSSINTSTTTPKHAVLPCLLRALPCLLRFGVFCQRTLQVCQTKWDCTGQWRFVFTCFQNCSGNIRHIWHLRVLCMYIHVFAYNRHFYLQSDMQCAFAHPLGCSPSWKLWKFVIADVTYAFNSLLVAGAGACNVSTSSFGCAISILILFIYNTHTHTWLTSHSF